MTGAPKKKENVFPMLSIELNDTAPVRSFELTEQDTTNIETFNSRRDGLELPRIMYRYDVGRFVAGHLKGNEGRHKEVLERIAKDLPQHPSTLRAWAKVAMVFGVDEFRSLVQRKTNRGNRLCWSHYVHLSRVYYALVRQSLIEEVFERDLRTAELREYIRVRKVDGWSLKSDPATADHLVTVGESVKSRKKKRKRINRQRYSGSDECQYSRRMDNLPALEPAPVKTKRKRINRRRYTTQD